MFAMFFLLASNQAWLARLRHPDRDPISAFGWATCSEWNTDLLLFTNIVCLSIIIIVLLSIILFMPSSPRPNICFWKGH